MEKQSWVSLHRQKDLEPRQSQPLETSYSSYTAGPKTVL
jgi:hypothetical protein